MAASANIGEERPGPFPKKYPASLFFLFLLLTLLAACFQKRKENPAATSLNDRLSAAQKNYPNDTLEKPSLADSLKKKIYLTFDDGPNNGTLNVLKAVQEDSIPASFFIVGKHVFDIPGQKATWQQLRADSSIELCNHSYTHALNRYRKYYSHPDAVVKDFTRNNEQLGFNNSVVRMPGRNAWRIGPISFTDIKKSKAAVDAVHRAGFDVMGWDLEWVIDHKTLSLVTDPALLFRQIENRLSSGKTKTPGHLVLLAHDQAFQTRAAMAKLHLLFRQIKNNPEYEMVFAGSYPGIEK